MATFVVPLLVVAWALRAYAHSRDRERENPPAKSKWRVRQEYIAAERERMRALEDAILDPPDQRWST